MWTLIEAMERLIDLRIGMPVNDSGYLLLTNAADHLDHQFWERVRLTENKSGRPDPVWARLQKIEEPISA